jgi:hypothetical protein
VSTQTSPYTRPLIPGYLLMDPPNVIMDFGKHKGSLLSDAPVDYLRWALREIEDAPEAFRQVLRDELHRRLHEGVGEFSFEDH